MTAIGSYHSLLASTYFRPKEQLNIWQWADKFRIISKGVSNVSKLGPVKYDSSITPHQRGIQESFTDPDVQMTVMIGASQIMGKTEVINNLNGYFIHWKPTGIVIMYPTVESAEKYSKRKFTPMISSTPELASLILPSRERDSGNKILEKEFPGGSIFFVGSNSAPSLRGASGEVLEGDEIDSMESGSEGDPIELLWKRGESYDSCVKVLSSTPTNEQGRIAKVFDISDKRYWYVPCVKCGASQVLKWSQIVWPKGQPENATMLCSKCAAVLDDKQRLDMYYAGDWKATSLFKGIRGFHFTGIYRMWKQQRGYKNNLHQFAAQHIEAAKSRDKLRVWTNTFLAETFREEAEGPSYEPLLLRREEYGLTMPAGVLVLTGAFDVQRDRIEGEIKGWGIGQESWGIEFKRFIGNTNQLEPWLALDEFLKKKYQHSSGMMLGIACAVIDSGDASTQKSVYSFVGPRQGSRVCAIKGSSVVGAPIVVPRLQKNGIVLYSIGTDAAKSTVYERIGINIPGPRYMHFPIDYKLDDGTMHVSGYTDEFFRQLVAEKVRTVFNRGFPKREWVKVYERNEALDINAYHLAAFEILNPDLRTIANNFNVPKNPPKEYQLVPAVASEKKPVQKTIPAQPPKLFKFTGNF